MINLLLDVTVRMDGDGQVILLTMRTNHEKTCVTIGVSGAPPILWIRRPLGVTGFRVNGGTWHEVTDPMIVLTVDEVSRVAIEWAYRLGRVLKQGDGHRMSQHV
ncbi:MAG: hypothetical protein OWU33_15425 [Firmicutes bacterium]|nr:hypothetical protein [Bacillota bacterium]